MANDPIDSITREYAQRIDGQIQEYKAEIREREADIERIQGEIAELLRFRGYVAAYGVENRGPGLTLGDVATNTPTNRFLFRLVLRQSNVPLRASEVWDAAEKLGATSASSNPQNATHAALSDMIGKGVKLEGRGLFAYDTATAPDEDKAQAAT